MTSGPFSALPPEDDARPGDESEHVRELTPLGQPAESDEVPKIGWRQGVLALLIAGLGVFAYTALGWLKPEPVVSEPEPVVPLVRVASVSPQSYRFSVTAHGTVTPRTESDLVAEVRGRVVGVAPALVPGGFFAAGDELLRLDDREHRIALERARANVALRRSEAKLAKADAGRRTQLADRGVASTADLEQVESRLAVANAQLLEARAALSQAELDLERTVVRAPFDGRVRERNVDIGQFVNPGTKLGRLQATDYAEVRLPIQTADLAFLDVSLDSAASGIEGGLPVTLSATLGGREIEWPARLVRSEGEIDVRTRTLHVVARVDDPYRRDGASGETLPSGLFVQAEITGRALADAFVIPPIALRDGNRVFVATADDRLEVRDVEVVRRDREQIVIGDGLAAGDRVIVSPLRIFADGMPLRTVSGDAS